MKTTLKVATIAVSAALASFSMAASAQVSGDVVKIGFITDVSGLYSDIDGQGGAEAIKMAIADFGGTVLGKKIELVTADHQNKPDIAVSIARQWFDRDAVDMLLDVPTSSVALALQSVVREKNKVFINSGAASMPQNRAGW